MADRTPQPQAWYRFFPDRLGKNEPCVETTLLMSRTATKYDPDNDRIHFSYANVDPNLTGVCRAKIVSPEGSVIQAILPSDSYIEFLIGPSNEAETASQPMYRTGAEGKPQRKRTIGSYCSRAMWVSMEREIPNLRPGHTCRSTPTSIYDADRNLALTCVLIARLRRPESVETDRDGNWTEGSHDQSMTGSAGQAELWPELYGRIPSHQPALDHGYVPRAIGSSPSQDWSNHDAGHEALTPTQG